MLVLLVLVAAFASYQWDLGQRLGLQAPDPITEPALVLPPPGLRLAAQPSPAAVAVPLVGGSASTSKVQAALRPMLSDRKLGGRIDVLVTDLTSGHVVYRRGDAPLMPASTMKLLTTTAALDVLGPGHRFATTVMRQPGRVRTPTIVLVGGGDPYLMSRPDSTDWPHRADLVTLAQRTALALRADHVRRVRLAFDASLFSGPMTSPAWPASYVPDGVVAPISALMADEGRSPSGYGFTHNPPRTAAQLFASDLTAAGVGVAGPVAEQKASPRAARIAAVLSPTLDEVVAQLLGVSDNIAAEVIAHQVGVKVERDGSFRGGAKGVRTVLARLGVPLTDATILDGSGLSRGNRLRPQTQMAVLQLAAAAAHPNLRAVVTGVPVAGFSGSLQYRFELTSRFARGRVRAKTGTLSGVNALAGTATDRSGDLLGFVIVVNRVKEPNTLYSRDLVDDMAAALAACRCGTKP